MNAPVTGYRVDFRRHVTGDGGSVDIGVSQHYLLTQLTAHDYDVRIAALNVNGPGAWSETVVARVGLLPMGTLPNPPALAAEPRERGAFLQWQPPPGVALIDGYRYRWSNDGDDATWENAGGVHGVGIPGGASAASFTIANLTNGTAYTVQVAAENMSGAGVWSNSRTVVPGSAVLSFAEAPPDKLTFRQGVAAAKTLPEARGGIAPVMYSLQGNLPAGLSFNAAARTISGTPSAAATANMMYNATDSIGAVLSANIAVSVTASGAEVSGLDVDDDGDVTVQDGIMISRYLLGVRGAALLHGQSELGGEIAQNLQARFDAETFNVNNVNATNAEDGILIARYLLGVRGAALADGVTGTWQVVEQNVAGLSEEELDADGSGEVTAADGILIARFLLGAHGRGLIAGQNHDETADAEARLRAGVESGVLDVDGSGAVNESDGILILRYLLGLRGGALVAGIMEADKAATVEANLRGLLAL